MIRYQKGFTLIELLIVVAIIAILAAIAIPNFLAAQTRAKVSRAKAEMRTMTTALESFRVDNTFYPKAYVPNPFTFIGWQTPDLLPVYLLRSISLTTPIAYITSVPKDPFNPGKDRSGADWSENQYGTYIYMTADPDDAAKFVYSGGVWPVPGWVSEHGDPKWRLASYGPARVRYFASNTYVKEGDIGMVENEYDPTNGTVSNGFIYRVGP